MEFILLIVLLGLLFAFPPAIKEVIPHHLHHWIPLFAGVFMLAWVFLDSDFGNWKLIFLALSIQAIWKSWKQIQEEKNHSAPSL